MLSVLIIYFLMNQKNNNMRLSTFDHYNEWHILPSLYITYEKDCYLSIDTMWLKWGISWVIKDK